MIEFWLTRTSRARWMNAPFLGLQRGGFPQSTLLKAATSWKEEGRLHGRGTQSLSTSLTIGPVPDEKATSGSPDRDCLHVNEDQEVRYWTKR